SNRVPLQRHLHPFPTRRSSDLDGSFRGNDLLAQTVHVDARGRSDVMLALTSDPTGAGSFYGDIVFPVLPAGAEGPGGTWPIDLTDRKSTRLNSSHQIISYAVFC